MTSIFCGSKFVNLRLALQKSAQRLGFLFPKTRGARFGWLAVFGRPRSASPRFGRPSRPLRSPLGFLCVKKRFSERVFNRQDTRIAKLFSRDAKIIGVDMNTQKKSHAPQCGRRAPHFVGALRRTSRRAEKHFSLFSRDAKIIALFSPRPPGRDPFFYSASE